MTSTMHKILIHGAVITKNALLPIGQLSEEAAEARNKHAESDHITGGFWPEIFKRKR